MNGHVRKNVMAGRWIIFNIVGAMGALVQLSLLSFLLKFLRLDYFTATGLAVEAAIIHNFLWHERWTWAKRVKNRKTTSLRRLLSFNLTTGVLSIMQNLILMRIFMDKLKLNCLYANLLAIVSCSLFNFFIVDQVVFHSIYKSSNRERP
jgi:putative flippase GtrA